MNEVGNILNVLTGKQAIRVSVDIPMGTIIMLCIGLLGAFLLPLLIYGAIFKRK